MAQQIPDPNAPCVPPEPVKVRLRNRPWEEIEVPAGEAEVMAYQGLLYDGPPVTEAGFDPRNDPAPSPKPDDKPAPKAGAKTKETAP